MRPSSKAPGRRSCGAWPASPAPPDPDPVAAGSPAHVSDVSCPGCGAPVAFRSAASVLAVCAFCRSTVLKDAASVRDIGKMAALLEDYSPVQLGVSGRWQGRGFSVVGRIQLRYDAGFWNEWYLLFDDGSPGWLGDFSGQYVLSRDLGPDAQAPAFDGLAPGAAHALQGRTFVASDVRPARCTGGEGELPFVVGRGWELRAADFRCGDAFLTLDYPQDGGAPRAYLGRAVVLGELGCQGLRSADDIARDSGRYRGKLGILECPACGGALAYHSGIAFHLVCPDCHAEVDASEDRALVLQKHEEVEHLATTLELGAMAATASGERYTVIGLLRMRGEDLAGTQWVEYLLHSPRRGFLWLVEVEQHWDRVTVLDHWPELLPDGRARLDGQTFGAVEDYGARVTYAAGAFNWRVAAGDRTRVVEYGRGNVRLVCETSATERVWSRAERLPPEVVLGWFGRKAPVAPLAPREFARRAAWYFSIVMVVVNLYTLVLGGLSAWFCTALALVLLWLPVFTPDGMAEE